MVDSMKIKIFDINNILAFQKKWASFYKEDIKIIKLKVDSNELILFYEEAKSNQELIILKESRTVLERKVNNLLESKKAEFIEIAVRGTNSFVAILVFKGE